MNSMHDVGDIYVEALRAVERSFIELGRRDVLAQMANMPEHGERFIDVVTGLKPSQQGHLLWSLNKKIYDPYHRRRIAELLVEASAVGTHAPEFREQASIFERDGLLNLPAVISPAQAEEMLVYFQGRANTTRQGTVLHHSVADVVRAPYAFRVATDPCVLAVASHHIGAPATIVQMDAWWSLPEGEKPHGAQVFHRDRDDFRSCKFFLYLSDVTSGDGPHIFVRESHRPDGVAAALRSRGFDDAKMPVFFEGNGRSIAHLIEGVFGSAVTEITGPRGTCFLENTFGFHRGKVPETGRRCIFQVLYAGIPYPDRVQQWRDAGLSNLPEDCADTPLARHAVRFITS